MELVHDEITLSQWGNSKALRLPAALANLLNFNVDDKLQLNVMVDEATGEKRLVVEKYTPPRTIEELFKDYDGESFQAKIQEFSALGNELW